MKTYRSLNLITLLLFALAFALGPTLRAETAEPAAPAEQSSATVAAPKEESVKPDTSKENVVAPETSAPAAAPAVPAMEAPAASDENKVESPNPVEAAATVKAEPNENKVKPVKSKNRGRHSGNDRVSILQNSTLNEGEQADSVVSILGSSTSDGDARGAVVSVLGSSTSSGDVGDAVVSVLGNTRVTGGTVGDVAVAVLGNTYINGHVRGEVVAVLGNVELGPDAEVGGEIVCIGGTVKRDPKAIVHGNIQNIAIAGRFFSFDWSNAWLEQCFKYARPLAFGEHLMWAWCVALAFLGFYALLALIAPRGVNRCVQTLEERPGYSILSSVLAMLLTPVAYILLALTLAIGIGFLLIPLFSLGLFFASLFGKVVILAWLGRRITKLFGDGPLSHPVFGVLIGGVLVLGLYTVPVLGFVVYKLIGLLGLGVVLYTLILSTKRNRPVAPPPSPAAAPVYAPAVPPVQSETAGIAAALTLPPVLSAATLPRVGFWLRFAAALLDVILVGIIFGMLSSMLFGIFSAYPLWLIIYSVVMWATKGTTIGGIICGLKVVRLDDRPLDWSVAIVRGLSAFLSLVVAGLGFIWVAFDDDRQSWHDKIAGTTIVKVPKGTPLL